MTLAQQGARVALRQDVINCAVIRTSDGEIRWMDVSEYLRKAAQPVKQIVFSGERFDVMSVRGWRDKALR